MYRFSNASIENRDGVETPLILISDLAIQKTSIDFGIPELGGLRTAEQQYDLFLQGVSKCDGIDKISKHQTGRALDFYAWVDGRASWEPYHLAIVAAALLQSASVLGFKLKWGGFFTPFKSHPGTTGLAGWDMGHVELA